MFNVIEYAGGALVVLVLIVVIVLHKRTRNLNPNYFSRKWRKLQSLCSDKKDWYKAVISADALLDEALKKKHIKGKTPGERLVAAQRYFSSNDVVWLSHKLVAKIKAEDVKKLTKKQTLDTLATFRLALKDLGAFSRGDKRTAKK
jgi:hypothetical protein